MPAAAVGDHEAPSPDSPAALARSVAGTVDVSVAGPTEETGA